MSGRTARLVGRGSYLVNAIAGCNDCHTNPDRAPMSLKINTAGYLAGGRVFAVPGFLAPLVRQTRTMAADLTGEEHGFFHEPDATLDLFVEIIRSGTHADEDPPAPLGFPMPWMAYRHMTDADLEAIYTYVKNVPARTGENDKETQELTRFCTIDADCRAGETCAVATDECVGGACSADVECGVCQTCSGGHCAAPAPDSPCLTGGL